MNPSCRLKSLGPLDQLKHSSQKSSPHMRFPTMWYVWPEKAQISLCVCAVWLEPLLVTWIFYDYWATDRTSFGASKLKRRLHRLFLVYTCQKAKLLEITCRGSVYFLDLVPFESWKWLYLTSWYSPCATDAVCRIQKYVLWFRDVYLIFYRCHFQA